MMMKNDGKGKSGRKPLKDVSNATNSLKPVSKISSKEETRSENDALDRLLLVQSDISSLIHQIDELVVQALKLNTTCKQGQKEIESFTNVLSDIRSSLNPWVPRFQKALSSPLAEAENKIVESFACKSGLVAKENKSTVVDSQCQTKFGSLVSPSPLVSWRANCADERGRHMFLLTPLPISKSFASNRHESSKSFLERFTSNNIGGMTSVFPIYGDTNADLLEGVSMKATPCKTLIPPSKFSKKDNSMLVMTPCLKRSPPKSCVLLEPISEFTPKEKNRYRKSTPFPVGTQNFDDSDSSSSSSPVSKNLALKYPELIGLHQAYKMGIETNKVEESFNWFMSPPKTCVIMEPQEAKSVGNEDAVNPQNYGLQDVLTSSFALPESTPMWKEPESTMRTGKRPGENTLKKELWTKFEAASTKPNHKKTTLLDTIPKDFLDRLNEVSCQPTSSVEEVLK